MVTFLAFAVAAAYGAVLRFGVGSKLNKELPIGTLLLNVCASGLLGFLDGHPSRVVYGVGLLGAVSTWSTLAAEVAELGRQERGWLAVLYLAGSVTSGVVAAWVGLRLGS